MTYVLALLIGVGSILAGAVLAARGRRVDVAEWTVGGRRFGGFRFWFVLAGAGILVALVPTAALLLTCGSLFARNVYSVVRPAAGGPEQLRVSRIAVIVLAAIAAAVGMRPEPAGALPASPIGEVI